MQSIVSFYLLTYCFAVMYSPFGCDGELLLGSASCIVCVCHACAVNCTVCLVSLSGFSSCA